MSKLGKVWVLLVLCGILLPILIVILWSFTSSWPWPRVLPQEFSLRGYELIFSQFSIIRILLSSIVLSLTVTILTLLICVPAARAMALYDFKGKKLVELLILMPLIVPMVTVAMGIHVNFIKWGLANSVLGVIIVHLLPGIPYGVRIMQSSFTIYGQSYELQGKNLGASKLQTILHVILPLMRPSLVLAGTMIYIISFSQYFITALIGGGRVMTYAMFYFPYVESGDRTVTAMLSIIFVGSIGLVLFVTEKFIGKYYEKSSEFLG